MPDWRNPEDYEYARNLTSLGWAWEFLRRSPKYQAAWDEFMEVIMARHDQPENAELAEKEKALRSQLSSFGLLTFHPPQDRIETPLWADFAPLYHPDPRRDATQITPIWLGAVGFRATPTPSTKNQPYPRGTWPGFPHSIDLTFSFTKPLVAQLEMAQVLLKEFERQVRERTELRADVPTIRFETDRYLLYLRLLDGRAAGVSIGEMGRELFGAKADTRNSAKQALRFAQRIAASRYKDLLWARTGRGE